MDKLRRQTLLYISVFLMMFGMAAQMTGVPFLAKRVFDATVWDLAVLGLTGSLGYAIFCLAVGRLTGRARPITIAMAGAVLYGAALALGLVASRFWHLVAIIGLGSAGGSLFWPMLEVEIARGATGRELSRRMGRFNTFWSLGDAAGAAFTGALYDVWAKSPFAIVVVSMTGVAIAVALARKMPVAPARARANGSESEGLDSEPDLSERFTKAAWVGNFVSAGVTSAIRAVFAAPARDVFRMSGALYGASMATVCIFRTISFVWLTHWKAWHYKARIYLYGNALLGVGMLGVVGAALLPLGPGVALVFVSFAIAGLSIGVTYYSSIFYSVHTENMAESNARRHEAVIGAGGASAIFASGASNSLTKWAAGTFAFLGPLAMLSPFAMCAAAVGAGMCGSAYFLFRRKDSPPGLAQEGAIRYPEATKPE